MTRLPRHRWWTSSISREGEDIVCTIDTPAEDADGDSITYTFAWALNGEAWDGDTNDTYELGDTISGADVVAGDEWTCAVEASAGGASAADSVSREVDRALLEAVVEYTMADLVGGGDTCSGAKPSPMAPSWMPSREWPT